MSYHFAEAVRKLSYDTIRVEWPETGWMLLKCTGCHWHMMIQEKVVALETEVKINGIGDWVRRHASCA